MEPRDPPAAACLQNGFEAPWVAERSVRGRPDVHAGIVGRIAERVAPAGRLERALDLVTMGCAWHGCEPGPFLGEAAPLHFVRRVA